MAARSPRTTNKFARSPFETAPPRTTEGRDSLFQIQQLVRPEDLSVVFQPIVHMDTLQVFAHEALTRCALPALRNPQHLFERAVDDGCVGRLGRMVREVAVPLCEGVPLFLNVHPAELAERWLVRPDDPLYFHDHDVYVEVTESVPLQHFELVRDVLAEVCARGRVQLVVDDFGAGYSNLERIISLVPRIVKLDRSLVANVTHGSRQQRLVRNIVALCADMGADVVAEGIETVEEFLALRDTGARFGQGYLFARPAWPLPPVSIPPGVAVSPPPPRFSARPPSSPSVPPVSPLRAPTPYALTITPPKK